MTTIDSRYHLGDLVYMRYQCDSSGNRGKVVAIKELDCGGAVEYTVETPSSTHFYGLYEEQLSPIQTHPATINDAVRVLNEALAADREVITRLLDYRLPCSEALADHPTIQVRETDTPFGVSRTVGLLGILNGILEPMTGHRIMGVWEDGQHEVKEFKVYVPPPL